MSDVSETALKLALVTIAMFGFGYALVPLYNVFCEITGLNGKTGTITVSEAASKEINPNRLLTVQLDTNVNSDLPWDFRVRKHQVTVHPGETKDVIFVVENKSEHPITGQAIPSVAPGEASLYFNKTECFCFTQQTLMPGEQKEMLVRFVVDPDIPQKISTLTLSYTFFMAPDKNGYSNQAQQESINTVTKREKI